jgi:SpoIVB peptidase S55
MSMRRAPVALLFAILAIWPLGAVEPFMPVQDVKPGMEGEGRTVFEGTRIESFKVHILGVLDDVMGPSRSLILARLEGGPLATTGVIAGMSGSPVYVDGRLIGAVSYSLGQFSREPIAGITPIAEMIDATRLPAHRPAPAEARLELPVTTASLSATLESVFARTAPFARSPFDVRFRGSRLDAPGTGPELGALLRPIATPLVMSGFSGDTAVAVADAFSASGFTPVGGAQPGRSTAARTPAPPLGPGDAIGVGLVNGDLSLGATGTVTDVVGDRVYAFGHPFYNLGPTTFPMTQAYVHTVLPSLESSSKVATLGRIVGTIVQDRATAIAGMLGPAPSMLPIHLVLETDGGPSREFRFSVVRDQLFTPLLTYLSVVNTLKSYEREFGASTFTVKGRALLARHDEIAFEDLFTGDSPSIGAASYIAGPIAFLLTNDYEPVEIDSLDLTIVSSEVPHTAELERVWLDAPEVRPGQTVPVKLLVRTYRGEEVTRTVPVQIPVNATGPLTLLVADGASLTRWEQRQTRQPLQARGVAQMVRAFNKARKNNRLYVRLVSADAGAVVSGEPLGALPASVLAVLDGERNGGDVTPLRSATLGEWDIPTDYAVSGARTLTLTLNRN